MSRTARGLLVALALATLSGAAPASARIAAECGVPASPPLWIDYGEGSVPPEVRAVFARPGVVVATSGAALPKSYRDRGAATEYWVLKLPSLVGQPSGPADPSTIDPAADALYARAVASSACATPWIALNELEGGSLPTPWSATNSQYRANVLELLKRLSARGAHPALLTHGNLSLGGAATGWWRQAADAAGALVYEAYYTAPNIYALGPVLGNRRMRLGIRSVIRQFAAISVPAAKLGFMLGFQVAPGSSGREGLQPREAWFRVIKWEVLTARQIYQDEAVPTFWSWGWGTFGPESVDPDKPAAACVYLWARDPSLCDGPGVAGPAFDTSLAEGQIALPAGVQCSFDGGVVLSRGVDRLAGLTRDRHVALTVLFAREALRRQVPLPQTAVLRAERLLIARSFRGSPKAYLRALLRRHTNQAVARGVIEDELRRRQIAVLLKQQGSSQTPLDWTADVELRASDTALCLRDELPGRSDFPRSNSFEVGVVPLSSYLPFLFRDRTPPSGPTGLTATPSPGSVTLAWAGRPEPDLAGYAIFRSAVPGGPYKQVSTTLLDRATYVAAPGSTSYYVVKAVDTSRNVSAPSSEVSATPG